MQPQKTNDEQSRREALARDESSHATSARDGVRAEGATGLPVALCGLKPCTTLGVLQRARRPKQLE